MVTDVAHFLKLAFLPPTIYETTLTMATNVRVVVRAGEIVTKEMFAILLSTSVLILVCVLVLEQTMAKWFVIIAFICQLNDYSGTIEPNLKLNE